MQKVKLFSLCDSCAHYDSWEIDESEGKECFSPILPHLYWSTNDCSGKWRNNFKNIF